MAGTPVRSGDESEYAVSEKIIEIAEEVHRRLIGFTLRPEEAAELLQILEYEILGAIGFYF